MYIKIAISFIAILLLLTHQLLPKFKVGSITIALLVAIALPWVVKSMVRYIKTLELTGIGKIELKDFENTPLAKQVNAPSAEPNNITAIEQPESDSESVLPGAEDPQLAIIAFRLKKHKKTRQKNKTKKQDSHL